MGIPAVEVWIGSRRFSCKPHVTFSVAKLRINFTDALVLIGFLPLAQLINLIHTRAGHSWMSIF